jgi:predicted RNase H-like HicB family nuclease
MAGRVFVPGWLTDGYVHLRTMSGRDIHVPYVVERDEDGVWCAHAQLQPGVGAHGEGDTPEAAADDLREALAGLVAEFGVPDELTLTVDAA